MSKNILPFVIVILLLAGNKASAQYRHQIGVRLGSADQINSTGISYRYFMSEGKAVEGILNLKSPYSVAALYEFFKPIATVNNLKWYYGAGVYAGFQGDENLGITGIAGLDYQFTEVPVNLSIDWKPELSVVQAVKFRAATVGVSVRFAFGKK